MDIVNQLKAKGYLYHSDEPGFYLQCADKTLGYRTWDKDIQPLVGHTSAPFGMIYSKSCSAKGSEVLFDEMRKSWNELNLDPEVLILTTSKCNLDCPYCIIGVNEGDEFRLPSVEQVEKAFKLFPVKRVVITGGEPLSEKDRFIELLDYLAGKIERCDIITNGKALDKSIWPVLKKASQQVELRIRLTLSEQLTHMKISDFEKNLLPQAREHRDVNIQLVFLPNHDGTGLLSFLKHVNELQLPKHITVMPSYLTESKVSGKVTFDIAQYLENMMEVAEHPEEYLKHVNFDSGQSLYLLVNDIQLLGCKRRTITLSDKGYALCTILHCEGQAYKGPLQAATFIWERLIKDCKECDHYPDHCQEAMQDDQCPKFKRGCNRCPLIYICTLRCPCAFEDDQDSCDSQDNLQCLGYPLLRLFVNWLMVRNKNWSEIESEVARN